MSRNIPRRRRFPYTPIAPYSCTNPVVLRAMAIQKFGKRAALWSIPEIRVHLCDVG